jgi:pteridine reductase
MSDNEYQRVALVTGGAVRVGRAISLALAEAGFRVVVHYHASESAAKTLRARVEGLGRECQLVRGDLSLPETAERLVGETAGLFGRLDLVVNNAACFHAQPLEAVDAGMWDEVMDVNVRAPHLLVRAAAPMLRANHGAVVNIVDLSAFQAWTEHPAHAVSKAALTHLTRVQARALAPEVRVNAIAPGAVLPPEGYTPERLEALRRSAPLGRLGTPEDVARTVLFLAESPFVTGQVVAVDGGRLLGPKGPPYPGE